MGNWQRLVWNQRDALMAGIVVTVEVCAIAFAIAVLVGLLLCLVRMYVRPLRPIVIVVIEFFRATPILVQLLWVNYAWPEIFGWPTSFYQAACTALALQSSGYLAETFRSGIEGLPKGHVEAGVAVGMGPVQIFIRIVLPQVALVMAPSLINQIAVIIKSSTLISVIAIPDLMYEALRIVNQWFEPIEILTSVGLLYFILIFAISMTANQLAQFFNRKLGLVA